MAQADLFNVSEARDFQSWEPTHEAARSRLDGFIPHAGRAYGSTRNFDFGPNDRSNISVLSPWVRHGLISEDAIIRATLKTHGFKSAEKFIMEVFWRGYFKGWLEHHPDVWRLSLHALEQERENLNKDHDLNERYQTAITGKTGIECFNSWVNELIEIGYLHNHARMWFASIWIFTLRLPWALGADFFYRNLLDGDPASNTLSWRWVGGLHTKGKNYTARASNIEKFTNGRFNPVGELNENPYPLTEDWQFSQLPIPVSQTVDENKNSGLLVTEEDYSNHKLLPSLKPSGVAILDRNIGAYGEQVQAFKQGALLAAQNKLAKQYNQKIVKLKPSEIEAWAANLRLEQVAVSYIPVGHVADALHSVQSDLENQNICFTRIMRIHDILTWPHTSRGFFKLKKKIPDILSKMGL